MKIQHVLLLVLVISIAFSAQALSDGEQVTLQNILETMPNLNILGNGWNSNTSTACTEPVFYGLTCSNDTEPHVVKLYVHFFAIQLPLSLILPFVALKVSVSNNLAFHYIYLCLNNSEISVTKLSGSLPGDLTGLKWLEVLYVVLSSLTTLN